MQTGEHNVALQEFTCPLACKLQAWGEAMIAKQLTDDTSRGALLSAQDEQCREAAAVEAHDVAIHHNSRPRPTTPMMRACTVENFEL